MAGHSLSPSSLRTGYTSPHPPFLVIKKLTPRRLPPIVNEGPKSGESQPPPPPPTPVPWSWYHRDCSPSPKPHSRHYQQQRNTNKSPKSPTSKASNELGSLCQFLNGRSYLLAEYALRFFTSSEREALVQVLQHNGTSSPGSRSSQHGNQLKSCGSNNPSYKTTIYAAYDENGSPINLLKVQAGSDPSSQTESDESPLNRTDSDEPAPCTLSSELDSDYSSANVLDNGDSRDTTPPMIHHMQVNFQKCVVYHQRRMALKKRKRVVIFALLFLREVMCRLEKLRLAKNLPKNDNPKILNNIGERTKVGSTVKSKRNNNRTTDVKTDSAQKKQALQSKTTLSGVAVVPRRDLKPTSKTTLDNIPTGDQQLAHSSNPKKTPNVNVKYVNQMTQTSDWNEWNGGRNGMTAARMLPQIMAPHNVEFSRPSVSAIEMYQRTPRRLPVPDVRPERPKDYIPTDVLMNPFGGRGDISTLGQQGTLIHQNTFNSRLGDFNQLSNPLIHDETTALEVWCQNATQEELVQRLPELVSTTLKYQTLCRSLLQQSRMSTFLLQVAQAVFEEMVSLDQLIKKILEVAQHLVSADRASLFLVDHRNLELVSTVFNLRYESNNDSDFSKKEIRMPINKGIAGHVAMSGETANIPDAYADERFNKAVDEATGYRTVSILCMPIKVRGKVIAVVQMVNKRDKEAFETDDEAAFQVFSTFFGLALHHARLYDKIKRKEQKYKVALEVLGYHNTCAEEDVVNLLEEREKDKRINYNDFALNPFEVNDIEKCKGILIMFDDMFDVTKFDVTVLARFVLTVKKNYRKVPYHNFDHGWAVANAMYVMLKHDTEKRFDYNTRLALFVACLCHDLDHRGYTNKFMSEIASPLAAVYTTSTLEHHHFNMTVTILQQDGHNIFYHMSSEEYKGVLDSIRQCILATDLAAFFPNLKKINELVFDTPQFDWSDVTHSALGRSFSMTCADLCAAAKPFEVQLETVQIISAEFYQQGDLERQAGRTPIPMMDRSRPEELPASQVGFLSQICLPCYEVLYELFPATKPMLTMAKANLESWKARASAIEENNKNT